MATLNSYAVLLNYLEIPISLSDLLRLAALGAGLADAFDRNNLITAKSGHFVEGFEDKIRYSDRFK